jgi:hypothetical protein
MNNPKNIVIVLLCVTAAIMAGMLVGLWHDSSAQAAYPEVAKGDYIMFPCSWSDDVDLLCVIDVATKKMKVYNINKTTHGMDVAPDVDLKQVFAAD